MWWVLGAAAAIAPILWERAEHLSSEDIARARRIMTEYTQALEEGKGAIAIDGEMVDAATLKMAEIVSAKADAAGL